jgi:hypothetical protein
MKYLLNVLAGGVLVCAASFGQDTPAPKPAAPAGVPEPVLVVDAGPCTADFVVRDKSGKAIYNAKITMKAQYGFMGFRRLDLTVGTNSDGKARIEGLPEKPRGNPDFKVAEGAREKYVAYDPVGHCYAQHDVVLEDAAESKPN